jgi:hypothetical protein
MYFKKIQLYVAYIKKEMKICIYLDSRNNLVLNYIVIWIFCLSRISYILLYSLHTGLIG